jgi:DNA-binding response OmpR family regulator
MDEGVAAGRAGPGAMHLSSSSCLFGWAHCRSFKKAPKILELDYPAVDRIRGRCGCGRPGVAMRLLLAEDNQRLRELLADFAQSSGLGVDVVGTVAKFFGGIALVPYDLGIVDLGLPDSDGLVAIRDLRSIRHGMPILVITARGSIEDRVNGLDIGADDYLIKAFNHAELLARLRALLRRPTELHGPILCKGNLELDESNGQARCPSCVLCCLRRQKCFHAQALLKRRPVIFVPILLSRIESQVDVAGFRTQRCWRSAPRVQQRSAPSRSTQDVTRSSRRPT